MARPSRRRRFRLRAPVAVAGARLRARPGRALLVVAGVAAATAALAGVVGGSLVAKDRTLQRALALLPASERSFRVDSFGVPVGSSYAEANRRVRAALARLTPQSPYALTSFRTLTVDGELVRLAGIDNLPRVAQLVSGRWPRVCRPDRCEVVQVGSGGSRALDEPGIHLVRVGTVQVPDRNVFGDSLTTTSPVAQARRPVLLLGNGAAEFEQLAGFVGLFRTYSWITPIDSTALQIWQVRSLLARESGVQALLARDGDTFALTGPDAAFLAALAQGHVAAQRMVLVGGELSALLLGFALVAAIGLRRGVWNESRRLAQRGARRSQVWLAVATEVGSMALVGAVAGLLAGVLAVIVIAGAAGLPAGAVLEHSIVSVAGLLIAAGAWAVATIAIVVAVSAPERRRRAGGVRMLDVAALGAAIAVVIGLSTGKASAGTLSGDRLLYVLLPGLICFVAAVAAGRLLGPAMRLGERSTRRAAAAVHLAFLALARAPARTVATVGFLLVSIGLALFAVSYRATLADGARDEAAFAVPLDFTLTEGSQLVLPLQNLTGAALRRACARGRGVPGAATDGERRGLGHDGALPDRDRASRSGDREAALASGLLEPLARRDLAAPRRRRPGLAARGADPGRSPGAQHDGAHSRRPGDARARRRERRAAAGGSPARRPGPRQMDAHRPRAGGPAPAAGGRADGSGERAHRASDRSR